jgi:hypothetical protein
MARLERNIDCMKVLSKSKKRLRQAVIKESDKDLIRCLSDCAHNILNGNIPLEPEHFKKLRKYKLTLRDLNNKKLKIKDKRNILINQKGGFLPLLITPILSIAAGLIADVIAKK